MKCKFCDYDKAIDIKDLREHVRGKHKAEWQKFAKQMAAWESAHLSELGASCSICPHRGKHFHG